MLLLLGVTVVDVERHVLLIGDNDVAGAVPGWPEGDPLAVFCKVFLAEKGKFVIAHFGVGVVLAYTLNAGPLWDADVLETKAASQDVEVLRGAFPPCVDVIVKQGVNLVAFLLGIIAGSRECHAFVRDSIRSGDIFRRV